MLNTSNHPTEIWENHTITPTTGARERLSADRLEYVESVAIDMLIRLAIGNTDAAVAVMDRSDLDADERVALWTYFDSKQRTAMKEHVSEG